MSLAPQELENSASKYAAEAIRLDSEGSNGQAISAYQRAVEALVKLVQIYPDYKLNKIYTERANSYQNRIKALQMSNPLYDSDINKVGQIDQKAANSPNSILNNMQSAKKRNDTNGGCSLYFEELLMTDKPNVSWNEVIGLEDAKRAMRESIVYPTIRPDLLPLGWARGILLFGPPGCGKTLLAAAAAAEIEGYFINVDAMARKLHDSEGVPVLIFVDEIDSLLGNRNSEVGGEVRVKNQFLTEMDGINGKSRESKLYVIGATNKPWSLEAGFLRRFQKRIYVSLPNRESRIHLFDQYTRRLQMESSLKIEDLAKISDGYSGSDVKDICQSVQLRVVDELFQSGKGLDSDAYTRSITELDFKEILKMRKPSVSMDMIRAYARWSEQFKAL